LEARAEPVPGLGILVGARTEKYQGLDAEVTPRASITWDAVPDRLRLRSAWGRAYKAPNLREQFVDNPFIESNPD
ncbi:MAG: TonB-dependent receptor, partial [Gemmatimonadetes bacterium]|nr:TonB-dependent receptor [Gemmatimonadota bacterium]NIQ53977.1 TonB-dependent receptor [Gemmatimonadota bacterium]NIU74162.1 TonB-dependent receptor [Gammaproteobacteria bacterium]NIX20195.1 TonB-dependent receptor [Actinomycetota bacterium]NIX44196.1 TonB-dependent receptor [Gemmatimonadota bacterium]